MFFSGALGALFMYSILHSRDEDCWKTHRQAHDERVQSQEIQQQRYDARKRSPRYQATPKQELDDQSLSSQRTQSQVVYVPREVIREVVVDCTCKCACKEPDKPDIPRSFWSLDKGNAVSVARDKEAKKMREQHREEVAEKTVYWSLDQGMHADMKRTS